jgi:hypothetical protein
MKSSKAWGGREKICNEFSAGPPGKGQISHLAGCVNFSRRRTVRSGPSALEMWPYWFALERA